MWHPDFTNHNFYTTDYYVCQNSNEIDEYISKDVNVSNKKYLHYKDDFFQVFAAFLITMNYEFKKSVEIAINILKTGTSSNMSYNFLNYNILYSTDQTNSYSGTYSYSDPFSSIITTEDNYYNTLYHDEILIANARKECVLEYCSQDPELNKFFLASLNKYILLREQEKEKQLEQTLRQPIYTQIDEDQLLKIDFDSIKVN